jgi:hypothetical protein
MVFWAVVVVLLGIVLKLIAAEPGSMFLLPLAAVAGFYHVTVHKEAARSPNSPVGLATISDILMLGALLMQIDFGSYNCGHTTIDGVSWIFGWSSESASSPHEPTGRAKTRPMTGAAICGIDKANSPRTR